MLFDGVEYKTGRDGKYQCPWACSDPNYPQRTWLSDKGFTKHLNECKAKPELVWVPEPKPPREKFGECPDCGSIIWKMSSCWRMPEDLVVCLGCYHPYFEAEVGFHDCAGLMLPGMSLEG